MINISLSTRLDKPNTFIIYGEKGEISVPNYWKSNQASLIKNDGTVEEFYHPMPSEFRYEIDEIAELINKGKKKVKNFPRNDDDDCQNCGRPIPRMVW
ncbi:hypothetical protein OBG91_09790 [Lactococcus lactis]|nr:hypothetical protein [Lactococcus lactis]